MVLLKFDNGIMQTFVDQINFVEILPGKQRDRSNRSHYLWSHVCIINKFLLSRTQLLFNLNSMVDQNNETNKFISIT